jgi:hypothetical protein
MALDPQRGRGGGWRGGDRRLSTETKHASKTTEFIAYLAVLAGILIASAMISDDDGNGGGGGEGGGDYFTADEAWRLVTFLTIGYMIARGLAKSGSREPYWEGGTNAERGGDDDDDRAGAGRGSTVAR